MNKIPLSKSYSKDLFAAGAFAAAATLTSFLAASSLDNDSDCAISKSLPPLSHPMNNASAARQQYNYLATKPHTTSCETMKKSLNKQTNSAVSNQTILECDYAIIGHGKAGQSAVRMLRDLDPDANIIVIDPNDININSRNQPTTNRTKGSINLLKTHASHIDHSNKMIRLHSNPSLAEKDSSPVVHFHKSALIATGSRGAPPPKECISKEACERVLELRSTSLPPTRQTSLINQQHGQEMVFPTLDPRTVRSLSFLAASQSATVAIMGSGFEALEMAASLSRLQQQQSRKGGQNGDSNKKVILLFGNAGPMSTQLPRYLSAAVSKKLRQCGIEVEDRSIARYVSMESSRDKASRLALYTEKSYDHLDSRKITADLVVLAPSVDGNNGTAVIPTYSSFGSSYNQDNQQRYLPWSSLISPPRVTCFLDDGRIATNSEYQAASNIYAAGSVTRSPNSRNGRADVAGGNSASSARVGEIAARNMVRDHASTSMERMDECLSRTDIPVWRSDVVHYLPKVNNSVINESTELTSNSSNESESYTLYSMGIHALCVGRCDSETFATHGFWWTNTNQQSNNNDEKNSSSSDGTRGRRMNTSAFMRRITRKATSKVGHKSRSRGGSLPVYGSGVIYYLDRMGSICGIMLWGLPFSQVPQDVKSGINHPLVERMKQVIRSNGAVAIRKHSMKISEDYPGLNVDLNLLSYLHLVEESKLLASMAMSGFNKDESITLGKPLHRYTPIKSHELSSLGKLRRREMGYPAEADDLYYPVEIISSSSEVEYTRPPSLKRIYPMNGGATTTSIEKEMEIRQLQIDRSRPPKEEPLWIRKGEEQKFVNYREAMDHSFYHNIQQGKFIDGTDAVKQAPVPEVYLEAKEQFKSWTGTSTSSHQSEEENEP